METQNTQITNQAIAEQTVSAHTNRIKTFIAGLGIAGAVIGGTAGPALAETLPTTPEVSAPATEPQSDPSEQEYSGNVAPTPKVEPQSDPNENEYSGNIAPTAKAEPKSDPIEKEYSGNVVPRISPRLTTRPPKLPSPVPSPTEIVVAPVVTETSPTPSPIPSAEVQPATELSETLPNTGTDNQNIALGGALVAAGAAAYAAARYNKN